MEEKFCLDDYCSLDDSSNIFSYSRCRFHLYGHAIYTSETESASLLFLMKPKNVRLSYKILEDFIKDNLEDKKLIACTHYGEYPQLRKQIHMFCDRGKIKKKKIREELAHIFQCADHIVSARMRSIYCFLESNKEAAMHYLLQGIREGEKELMLASTRIRIYGFDKYRF
ncbi:MAG: hypothetical protein ABIB71_09755 [Candidatus Woesearchaeota archaeon]